MNKNLSAKRFSGKEFVETYESFRPVPPTQIVEATLRYFGESHCTALADLGCGNGIGTYIWQGFADQITGIDPSDDMLQMARQKNQSGNVRFLSAFSDQLPLENASVDIVTISQAFHWMEPVATLREIDRILQPNGVLSIYDCKWPPQGNAKWAAAFKTLFDRVALLSANLEPPMTFRWPKKEHANNIRTSGLFSEPKITTIEIQKPFTPIEFIGLARSQGGLKELAERGFNEEETGWEAFLKNMEKEKPRPQELIFAYTLILAKKGGHSQHVV